MRKTIFLLSIVMLTFSCSKKNEYVINGTAPEELNGEWVFFMDFSTSEPIDSVMVEEGKFSFTGQADPTQAARVGIPQKRIINNVILEKDTTFISLSDPTATTGTPLNEAFRDFNLEIQEFYKGAREKMEQIREEYASEPEVMQEKMKEFSNEVEEKTKEIANSYLTPNLDNGLALFLFPSLAYGMTPEEVDALHAQLGEKIKQNPAIQKIMTSNENIKNTQAGKMFTDFTIENGNLDESSVSLSDYVGKGKYVLVDFWASWCGPCIREFPVLREVYEQYKGDKFELLGVAVWDKREKTIEAIEKHEMTWPVILDAQQIPTDLYGISGIPQIILFGPDGTIIARDLRGEAIKAKLAELL